MFDCTHGCFSCGESHGERTTPQDFRTPANGLPHTGKIIAVVSSRGDVGKSLITSSLAVAMRRMGKTMDVLDADITGLSIPTAFGVHTKAESNELGVYPAGAKTGIEVMSLNLLIEDRTDLMVWRGPAIAGAVKQFWTDVIWGDVGYLSVDIPPRTSDVPLTMFQSLSVDGIVVIITPRGLVSMTVTKAAKMAEMIHIPVLGPVKNYSYLRCPNCGKEHTIFGESHIERVTTALGLKVLARLPIDPAVAAACGAGWIEELDPNYLTAVTELLAE